MLPTPPDAPKMHTRFPRPPPCEVSAPAMPPNWPVTNRLDHAVSPAYKIPAASIELVFSGWCEIWNEIIRSRLRFEHLLQLLTQFSSTKTYSAWQPDRCNGTTPQTLSPTWISSRTDIPFRFTIPLKSRPSVNGNSMLLLQRNTFNKVAPYPPANRQMKNVKLRLEHFSRTAEPYSSWPRRLDSQKPLALRPIHRLDCLWLEFWCAHCTAAIRCHRTREFATPSF